MTETPTDYDCEFTTPLEYRVRRRIGYSHERGQITEFVVQIEFDTGDDWTEVVRFDHDSSGDHSHDVTEDGVHMDVYKRGDKLRAEEVFPPMPADDALTFAEEHLAKHAERYVERFEEWHGIGTDR